MDSYLNFAKVIAVLVPLIALLLAGAAQAQTDNKELVAKGEYIFPSPLVVLATAIQRARPTLAGDRFPIPFGTVYSTNLTADKETGLGGWTDQEIADAVTKGVGSRRW